VPEVQEQIAFADVILLNKIDLVPPSEVDRLEARIKSMNAVGEDHPLQELPGRDGPHPERWRLRSRPRARKRSQVLEPEYPFEWGGVYALDRGTYELLLHDGPDSAMSVCLVPAGSADAAGLDAVKTSAVLLFSEEDEPLQAGGSLEPGQKLVRLQLTGGATRFSIKIEQAGLYALFNRASSRRIQD